jgi:hypothetical protein
MALAEADMGLTEMAMHAEGATRPGDETLLVKFYHTPRQNEQKSQEEGRPIFEDAEYVSIMVPGQKDNIIERPVRESDKERFPRHYAAFKNREEQTVEGTALEQWPGITRSQCEELKFFNITTVEQLAQVSDSHAQNFMGIQLLRTRAKTFMEAAKENAANENLAAELEARDAEIESLKVAMADMAEQLKELRSGAVPDSERDTKPGRRRGRAGSGD